MKKVLGYIFIFFSLCLAIFTFCKTDVNLHYFGGRYEKNIVNVTDNDYRETFIGHKLAYYKYTPDLEKSSMFFRDTETKYYRGFFTSFMIFILSLFMLPKLYLGSYLLFFTGLFLINPQKINTKIYLGILLILALCLRLCGLGEYPMWIDEVFTMLIAKSHWKNVLADYCNPPVFYILSKLWLMLVPYKEICARLLSVIFGVGGVWSLYYLLKCKINKKTALVGATLMAVSFWGIYYSQELRCYSFLMFIAPLCTLCMFNMLEKQRTKDYWNFGICSAIIINTHLYGLLFVVSNFLYVLLKNLKDKKIYLIILLTFTSFLPYFFTTFLQHSLLSSNALRGNLFLEILKIIGLFIVLLLGAGIFILCLKAVKYKTQNTNSDFFRYCFFTIITVVAFSFVISMFRLIIYYRYYSILYPFILSIIAIIISQEWKTKYNGVILTALVLVNIFFQFKFKFPQSLRYGNFYDVIKIEQQNNIAKDNIVVVLDYLTYYANYYNLKGAKTILYKDFNIDDIKENTSVYLLSFKNNKQDLENKGRVVNLPDDTKLIRIDR